MTQIFAIVLAAGQGKRMKSDTPKVAHKLLEKPLLQWTIDALLAANIKYIMAVISRNSIIENILASYDNPDVRYCYQDKPLGTAHAVQCGLNGWSTAVQACKPREDDDIILIAYGDTPAVKSETYQTFTQFHRQEENALTIIAFYSKNPFGYGRIIIDDRNNFVVIREEKDCSGEEKRITLCHSGLMCANFEVLREILPKVGDRNSASEFYLTDVIQIAKNLGYKVGFMASNHENEFSGVNTPEQLESLGSTLCVV